MGTFRFRKGVSLGKGMKLNITKHGISSLSLGGKGLTYNIGRKGTKATGSMEGTGLSYSEYSPYDKARERTTGEIDPSTGQPFKESGTPWGLIVLVALVVLGVYLYRTLYS